jgi:hypothetical protein
MGSWRSRPPFFVILDKGVTGESGGDRRSGIQRNMCLSVARDGKTFKILDHPPYPPENFIP